jgi:uncharacterized membrane protein
VGAAGLGLTCLVYGSFAPQWAPLPSWLPWRHAFAYASGLVLLVGGLGVLVPRVARRAALALNAFGVAWLASQLQGVPPGPMNLGAWIGYGEALAEALGAAVGFFTLWTLLGDRPSSRIAQLVFGMACVLFGLAHFEYADFTATMIPRWLPAPTALVYFTGACHVAAALALLTTVCARLAATLEAAMLGTFVLFVHVPSFVLAPDWAPSRQSQAVELCLALLIGGSAALVAVRSRSA